MMNKRPFLMAVAAAGLCMMAEPGAAGGGAKAAKTVEARVLVDGAYGKPNDVVTVDAEVAANSPELDAHPKAVAYAKQENARRARDEAIARGEAVE